MSFASLRSSAAPSSSSRTRLWLGLRLPDSESSALSPLCCRLSRQTSSRFPLWGGSVLSPEDSEVRSIPRLTLWSAGFPTSTLGVDSERRQAGRGPGRWGGIDRAGVARSQHNPLPRPAALCPPGWHSCPRVWHRAESVDYVAPPPSPRRPLACLLPACSEPRVLRCSGRFQKVDVWPGRPRDELSRGACCKPSICASAFGQLS